MMTPDELYAAQQAAIANGALDTPTVPAVADDPAYGKTFTLSINELSVVRLALMDRMVHLHKLGIPDTDNMVIHVSDLLARLH